MRPAWCRKYQRRATSGSAGVSGNTGPARPPGCKKLKRVGDYYQALEAMAGWSHYYNYERPHSALNYLRPVDYYRGDPGARLAEREQKLARAATARAAYWRDHADVVKERCDPSQKLKGCFVSLRHRQYKSAN